MRRMSRLSSAAQLEAWERREGPVLAAIPYVLLAISSILTVIVRGGLGTATLLDLALAGLAALWMLWMVTLHPTWTTRTAPMAVYFAGLLALMMFMVVRAPWFGFFAWSGYLYVYRLLKGGWRIAGLAVVAVVVATSQNGGFPRSGTAALTTYMILIAINVLLIGVLSWFGWIGSEQHARRKQALADLAQANSRLEAALQENAGLHAQLLTQAREAGVLDERQRLARDIHDTLAQGFTGIIAQLEAAKQAPAQSDQWQEHVDRAQGLARESLAEARRSVQALRPEPLEEGRLPEAISAMAQRWAQNSAVGLTVETTGEPRPLLAEIEVTLYRIAQESLTNVAKHARASRVGVTLSYLDDVVLLDVRDDGVGFSAESSNGRPGEGQGFGLSAMRQRVRQVAGTLEIESAPGEGTAICASVPALAAGGGT
jgi:signal transduction histidine kinase